MPSRLATPGPTCAVSPSMVCLPVNTRSTDCSAPILRMAAASAYEVASVSAPAKARSVTRIASLAPKLRHLRSASSACGGPMHSTVTRPPKRSFRRSASSSANRSYGLTMAGTPCRMMVLVTGWTRICAESGTCLDADDDVHGGAPECGSSVQAARASRARSESRSRSVETETCCVPFTSWNTLKTFSCAGVDVTKS